MKLNEIKRMQQLAGITNEDLESDIKSDLEKISGEPVINIDPDVIKALKSGKIVEITPKTKLKVGDLLVRMINVVDAQITAINGDKYRIRFSFDAYENEKTYQRSRRELENYWALYKK